ncbi:MAG: hypothetical protein CMJ76_10805 [Planctomycetaceae bacterium]|nr:hypothetical protein [Planctomycetaceae bacterium]
MKLKSIVLVITALSTIFYTGILVVQNRMLRESPDTMFLELAPVDPLSLFQGQYMTIEFDIEREQHELVLDVTRPESMSRFAVFVLDGDRVGKVSAFLKENPSSAERSTLAGNHQGQKIIILNVDLKRVTGNKYAIVMKQKQFLFRENQQESYAKARYGYFRVSYDGRCSLEDLAGESFELLSPQ